MSKRELIEAYVHGQLDRRGFVRGLTALGVSASAAVAYAHSLRTAAAAPGGTNATGFVMRAQVDDEYGTACSFPDDGTALSGALASVLAALAVFDGLDGFSSDDFEPGVYDELLSVGEQLADQADALETAGGTATAPASQSYDSAEALIAAAADALNAAASAFAGVIPAIETDEQRQTATSVGLVVARMAAYLNVLNGDAPTPAAFEDPTCP